MNENKINKFTEMLCSKDLEIRKLAVKILENQYDLDFIIYGLVDVYTYKYRYSLDIKDGYDPIALEPKDLLDRYTINPLSLRPSLHLAKSLINVIIKYNDAKRK